MQDPEGLIACGGKRGPQIEVKVPGPEGPGIIPSAKLVLMKDLLSAQAALANVPSSSLGEPVLSKNNSYSIDATLLHYDFQSTTFLAPLPAVSRDTSGLLPSPVGTAKEEETGSLASPSGEESSFVSCFGLSRDYSFQEESYEY